MGKDCPIAKQASQDKRRAMQRRQSGDMACAVFEPEEVLDANDEPEWLSYPKLVLACAMENNKAIRRICSVKGRNYVAILDTGAEVNLVSKRLIMETGYESTPVDKDIRAVGKDLTTSELVYIDIEMGSLKARIQAYVMAHSPVDILLGVPFLWSFSRGFRIMTNNRVMKGKRNYMKH